MRKFLIAGAALLIAATAAMADDDVMATRFGNTTVSKDAAGNTSKLYYNADGTFTAKQGDTSGAGTWKVTGSTICLNFSQAIPNVPNPTCLPVAAHKVGDTWTTGPYTVSLVAGIQ